MNYARLSRFTSWQKASQRLRRWTAICEFGVLPSDTSDPPSTAVIFFSAWGPYYSFSLMSSTSCVYLVKEKGSKPLDGSTKSTALGDSSF